jgi:hypothetical protein
MLCPKCGHDLDEPVKINYNQLIHNLIEKRHRQTRRLISELVYKLNSLDAISAHDLYKFLRNSKDKSDSVLKYYIKKFLQEKEYVTKGINYLSAMVANHEKNLARLKNVEGKIYGTKPPEKELNKDVT